MSAPLYTRELLRLAADASFVAPLSAPDAEVELRSSVCGSRIRVAVCLDADQRITAYAHKVNACALGQASATLVARGAKGRSVDDVRAARAQLCAFLDGRAASPGEWPDVDTIAVVRGYPARHAAVLLPFDAAIAALERATNSIAA